MKHGSKKTLITSSTTKKIHLKLSSLSQRQPINQNHQKKQNPFFQTDFSMDTAHETEYPKYPINQNPLKKREETNHHSEGACKEVTLV
jgi:hypothetical protein